MIVIEDQVAGFEIPDIVADQIDTVGDLMRAIESLDNNCRSWALSDWTARSGFRRSYLQAI